MPSSTDGAQVVRCLLNNISVIVEMTRIMKTIEIGIAADETGTGFVGSGDLLLMDHT